MILPSHRRNKRKRPTNFGKSTKNNHNGRSKCQNRICGDTITNRQGTRLELVLSTLPLSKIPFNHPTYFSERGMSIVDHIIITDDLILQTENSTFQGPSIISDHLPTLVYTLKNPITYSNQISILKKDWSAANLDEIKATTRAQTNEIDKPSNPEEIYAALEKLTMTIKNTIGDKVPTKITQINRQPLPRRFIEQIKKKRKNSISERGIQPLKQNETV